MRDEFAHFLQDFFNGYIGEQVKKEIAYARKIGKEVIFHTDFMSKERL